MGSNLWVKHAKPRIRILPTELATTTRVLK